MKKIIKYFLAFIILFPAILLCACNHQVVHKLCFVTNGEIVHVINTNGNEKISLPEDPTLEGYVFDGWYLDENYTTALVEDSYLDKTIDKDVYIFAKWLSADCRIIYNLDGGNNGNNPAGYKRTDESFMLEPAEKFGYVFNGWFSEPTFQNQIEEINTTTMGDIELYAKFDLINPELEFVLNNVGVAVSGYTGTAESVIIPEYYSGKQVYLIKENAFSNLDNLTSITIPKTVTTLVGHIVFNCNNFSDINIQSLDDWYNYELDECIVANETSSQPYRLYVDGQELHDLTIPASVENINSYAFAWCSSLQTVTFEEGVKTIGEYCFAGCNNINTLNLSSTLERFDDHSFFYCCNINRINIDKIEDWLNIEFVGDTASFPASPNQYQYMYVFSGFSNPIAYAKVLYIDNVETKDIVVPSSVSTIKPFAFAYSEIETVSLQNVETIGAEAFWNCEALQEISFSTNLTTISKLAFEKCTQLAHINLPDSLEYLGERAFYDTTIDSLFIPANVTYIGTSVANNANTFIVDSNNTTYDSRNDCNMIIETATNKLIIGANLTHYNGEFRIPDGVESIGTKAFWSVRDSYSFVHIIFPDSLKTIETEAFCCDNVIEVTFGTGMQFIATWAFSSYDATYTDSYSIINIPDIASWCKIEFESLNANPLSRASAKLYINGEPIEEAFGGMLDIPEGVEYLHKYAFPNISGIDTINIPSTIKYIKENVFQGTQDVRLINYGATNAEYLGPSYPDYSGRRLYILNEEIQLNIASNVKVIPSLLLQSLGTAVTKVVFEEDSECETIEEGAFLIYTGSWYCTVRNITLPDSIKTIGDRAFYDCKVLQEINIPKNVTSIGRSAFYGCESVSKIYWNAENATISEWSTISVGENGNRNLIVEIGVDVKTIPSGLFGGLYIKEVKFAEGYSVENIGSGAFNCVIESLYLPNLTQWLQITFANESANPLCLARNLYINNEKVTRVRIDGVTQIKDYAFYTYYPDTITEIVLADTIENIASHSFNWSNLESVYCESSEKPSFLPSWWNRETYTTWWCNVYIYGDYSDEYPRWYYDGDEIVIAEEY